MIKKNYPFSFHKKNIQTIVLHFEKVNREKKLFFDLGKFKKRERTGFTNISVSWKVTLPTEETILVTRYDDGAAVQPSKQKEIFQVLVVLVGGYKI